MAPPKTIQVVQGTTPVLTFQHLNFNNESQPSAIVNITDYEFELTVKRDLEDTDAEAWFTLPAVIVSETAGTYSLTFTKFHTLLPAGTWPGEIKIFPDPMLPPSDAHPVSFVVLQRVSA
jgi:hypothetical protein